MTEFNFNYADNLTLNFGQTNAANTLTIVLNLGCPDSRKWVLANRNQLD